MVVVVDDFDSGFVDFGSGGGMMFDFFSSVGLMAVVVAMVVLVAMVWWYGV